MMSPYDFDNLAALAKDRHAEMSAQARQQQLLNQATPASPHAHRVWQWLQDAVVDRVRHAGQLLSPRARHSVQHH